MGIMVMPQVFLQTVLQPSLTTLYFHALGECKGTVHTVNEVRCSPAHVLDIFQLALWWLDSLKLLIWLLIIPQPFHNSTLDCLLFFTFLPFLHYFFPFYIIFCPPIFPISYLTMRALSFTSAFLFFLTYQALTCFLVTCFISFS